MKILVNATSIGPDGAMGQGLFAPEPVGRAAATSRATFAAVESLHDGLPRKIG